MAKYKRNAHKGQRLNAEQKGSLTHKGHTPETARVKLNRIVYRAELRDEMRERIGRYVDANKFMRIPPHDFRNHAGGTPMLGAPYVEPDLNSKKGWAEDQRKAGRMNHENMGVAWIDRPEGVITCETHVGIDFETGEKTAGCVVFRFAPLGSLRMRAGSELIERGLVTVGDLRRLIRDAAASAGHKVDGFGLYVRTSGNAPDERHGVKVPNWYAENVPID